MHKFYMAGPSPAADYWRGRVCEVNDDETAYLYHSSWPQRSSGWSGFSPRALATAIAEGRWQLMMPAVLAVPAGI